MTSGFDLLHPAVQRRLWEMKWTSLRPIQDMAIAHILGRRGDCVIGAPTAGGKTEAAFLPILSLIAEEPLPGARAVYIGPLKALINDQFRRVEELCSRMEMPVHRWHGDVGETQKKAFLTRPSGVLLITPESLEAMFVLRPTQMTALFQRLAFVVIDELHAFIGSVRGAQLQSQLWRLRKRTGSDPARVGLSATLGEPGAACAWIRPDGPDAAYLTDNEAERRVAIRVKAYRAQAPAPPASGNQQDPMARELARDILLACHDKTNLVFANAKSEIEELADCMTTEAKAMGLRNEVLVHHGSLAKEQREYAEARLRGDLPCSAVCSNTLEMGIDIGEIDTVVQVAAPLSVSSLVQRLGRSGRGEQGAAVLRAFLVERAPDGRSTAWDGLCLDLVRGVSVIELMIGRPQFLEPPTVGAPQLSTLVHQLLSTLAETGGLPAGDLYERLMACRAFARLTQTDFATLLRALGANELIEQMAEGDIVLGVRGQKLCDHYSFYAAFVSPDEFRVLWRTDEIGTLPATMLPPQGDSFLLGGRRWLAQDIDAERREVHVVPGKGRRKPCFGSLSANIHPRIHGMMKEILLGTEVPAYLDETARSILATARTTAHQLADFKPPLQGSEEPGRTRLFLWAGTRVQRTFHLLFRGLSIPVEDHEVGLDVSASLADVTEALTAFANQPGDGLALAEVAESELCARVAGDKYDWTLPDALWRRAFVADRLDLAGATAMARLLAAPAQPR